jgi:hypothetical protein
MIHKSGIVRAGPPYCNKKGEERMVFSSPLDSLDFQIYFVFFAVFLAGAFLAPFFLSGIAISFL